MNRDERFKFYEKLYFYESDRREKVSARLSISFAAILANVGLLSFMLNSGKDPENFVLQVLFWILFTSAVVTLLLGAWFFRKAWYGATDQYAPTATQIESYYAELSETYREYENGEGIADKHFNDFLFDCLIKTSSVNAINNDERTHKINRANRCLTIAVLLSLAAAIPFYIGSILN